MENICRTCLTEDEDLELQLLDEVLIFKIKTISSVEIHQEDNLASKVCKACSENINNFYLFREEIINNDRLLKQKRQTESKIVTKAEFCEDGGGVEGYAMRCVGKEPEVIKLEAICDENENNQNKQTVESRSRCEFVCNLCNYRTVHRGAFWSHKNFSHEPRSKCQFCRRTVRDSNMLEHLKAQHPDKSLIGNEPVKADSESDFDNTCPSDCDDNAGIGDSDAENNMSRNKFENVFDCNNSGVKNRLLERDDVKEEKVTGKKIYACNLCDYQTMIRSTFASHKYTHMPKASEKTYSCELCNFKTTKKSTFASHKYIHMPMSACPICGKTMRKNSMTCHLKKHTGERKLKRKLAFNVEYDEQKNKIYSCKKCDFKSSNRLKLKNHRSIHADRKVCNICGLLVTASNIGHHMKSHTGSVTCEECGRVFKNAESYRTHPLMHIREENTCEICGKQCFFKGEFIRHKRVHKEKKRPKKCHICGKAFRDKRTLNTHIQSHTGERPHPCEYCGKNFSTSFALKTHVRQHTNERPYKCDVCPMAFPQRVSLRTHMKSKHNIEMKKLQ